MKTSRREFVKSAAAGVTLGAIGALPASADASSTQDHQEERYKTGFCYADIRYP